MNYNNILQEVIKIKKVFIFIAILVLLTGCGSKNDLSKVDAVMPEDELAAAKDKIAGLEKQVRDLKEELASTKEQLSNQNVVVSSPKKNRATFEIDERLVGRYIVEDDPEMYFEIKPDGTAEVSLNCLEGYGKYHAENLQLTAYYADGYANDYLTFDGRVNINFNLVSGIYTFPAACGLSLTFEDDSNDFNSFVLTTYWPDVRLTFVKQH
jgi:hypothetical protein